MSTIIGHPKNCTCDQCVDYWEKTKEQKPQQEQVKEWIAEQRIKNPIPDYTEDSVVSKLGSRIDELVNAHWNYIEALLYAGQDKMQTFTWDQVMEMRKWDYTSAAKHFYGHGYEDAVQNDEQLRDRAELERIKQERNALEQEWEMHLNKLKGLQDEY
jgi:hypothetical protein